MIYRLTKNTRLVLGETLFQIELIKDCFHGKTGTLGGYIQSEENLKDNAWVGDNALVFDKAVVCEDALVFGNARVYDNARVFGRAEIYDDARLRDNARIFGNAQVYNDARVRDNAEVYGTARISGEAWVFGNAKISGEATILGRSKISGTFETSPLQIQGTQNFFNISKENEITIGCRVRSIDSWLEDYESIGREAGYTESQIKEYKVYIDLAKLLSTTN